MLSDLGSIFLEFVEVFLHHLEANVLEIPFTISFGAAILLTIMFMIHRLIAPIIERLVIPMWICVMVTYFFPTLIPKEYEVISLIIFAVLLSIFIVIFEQYRRRKHIQRLIRT